jgi:[glutamine synthetase] adenylyltransferase / [glutamine synthetase]-adenylyl-L-tyrosine phosphorylase
VRLLRHGFTDPGTAEKLLAGLDGGTEDAVLTALSETADPDLALSGLSRLLAAATPPDRAALLHALGADVHQRRRLLGILGVSAALGEHLVRHPEDWPLAGRDPLPPTLVTSATTSPTGTAARLDELRVAYRRVLLGIAADDLDGLTSMDETAVRLSELADATLQAALAVALTEIGADEEPCRLAVIAMGKCGGRELNYVSDVDVVFVAEPVPGGDEGAALRTATRLASGLMTACSTSTAEGTIWEVDAGLRPEGRAGPLVRTLASHLAYYRRWAKTWEFQALLKARPAAGDPELGQQYVDAVGPLIWSAADGPNFVTDVQAMRQRVEQNVPRKDADRALKLGPGGLRDVEFSVQLLQLVHGRSDATLRSPTTLEALAALRDGGYVGRDDGAGLADAYRFLRTLEHRIQLHRLRRSSVVPSDERDLRRLGRSLGFRADPVADLTAAWRQHAREVRRLHEKLFYRPLLTAVAQLSPDEARLTPEAARQRLEALGYTDPAGALRHLEALTSGVRRAAAIQRTLLPVMLGWFADAPDPDAGLFAFRRMSEELGSTHWYLRLLRDESASAERVARLLASSRYAADLLLRAPESVALLASEDELQPRSRTALLSEIAAATGRHDDPVDAAAAARAVRRRELVRIAAGDVLGVLSVERVGEALSDVTAATIAGTLDVAVRQVETERRGPLPVRMAVIGMGRLGGHEQQYASDADVIFVSDPLPGAVEREASEAAHALAHELRRLLRLPAADPAIEVDAALRPEGRQGPLVRTLASYEAYYARWSQIWESQALLRAEPVAGDSHLGQRFLWLIDPMRWPEGGVDDAAVREIRRIKARVEAERLPRGADPTTHVKLGRGGLADVEWTVQLLQLQHAAAVPLLRTTRTLGALAAASSVGLLSEDEAKVLADAWRAAARLRNAVLLVRGRPGDSIPTDVRERASVARLLGYPPGESGRVVEDYRRVTRRARSVVERVFYG